MQHKWKRLISYYRPYRGLFFSDMVFAFLGAAVTLAIPLIVRYITTTVVLLPGEEALQTMPGRRLCRPPILHTHSVLTGCEYSLHRLPLEILL